MSTVLLFSFKSSVFFRHWEAIKKWDEAIQLTPENPVLYEMKSQVHTERILSHYDQIIVIIQII